MEKENNRTSRLTDSKLLELVDPQCSIRENVLVIKNKGFKISKDRISAFIKGLREKDDTMNKDNTINKDKDNTMNKDNTINKDNTMNKDTENAFEALKNDYVRIEESNKNSSDKTPLTRKEFNKTVNKMLKQLKETCIIENGTFDAKKDEIIDWAKHNFYRVTDKNKSFNDFMDGLRIYISKIKNLTILVPKIFNAKNKEEFESLETKIYKVVDSLNNQNKSDKARARLHELRLELELKWNTPF